MKRYDIVLVFANFRRSTIYLPVIKYLAINFSVAVFIIELPANEIGKTERTDKIFLRLCEELGADIVNDKDCKGKIAVIPQWHFNDSQLYFLKRKLKAKRYFWMVGLTMGNLHFEKLKDIKIDKLLIIDKSLYEYRLSLKPDERFKEISNDMIVEVGLPFKKYPVLEDYNIDYILANPTPLSLPSIINRFEYLICIEKIISQIPKDSIIALKPHNGMEANDYIVNKWAMLIEKIVPNIFLELLLKNKNIKIISKIIGTNKYYNLKIVYTYRKLMKRIVPLKKLTEYHNFSLELFLPNVNKGLITGRSNSIWHGLYSKLPVYNCVDKNKINENKNKMNYNSMKFFEVPYCEEKIDFCEEYFKTVSEKTREKDLIEWLRMQIETS